MGQNQQTASEFLAAQSDSDSPSSRLSDHFHRVRLTSLVLSCTLLLLTVRKPGKETSLLGVAIDDVNAPYLIIALLVAAAFSLGHACALWYSETRSFDKQVKAAKHQMSKIRSLVDKFSDMELAIIEADQDLSKRLSEVVSLTPIVKAQQSLLDATRSIRLPVEAPGIQTALNGIIFSSLKQLPTDETIKRSVDDGVKFYIEKYEISDSEALALRRTSSTLGQYLAESFRQNGSFINPADNSIIQQLRFTLAEYLREWTIRAADRVESVIAREEGLKAEAIQAVEDTERALRKTRTDIITPLQGARKDLRTALNPLRTATTIDKALIYGFDLASAVGLFAFALLSAIGSLLLAADLEIPRNVKAVGLALSALPVWVWFVSAVVGVISIMLYRQRRGKFQGHDS